MSISLEDRDPGALFELDGEPVAVTPTSDVEVVSDEDDRIVLTDESWREAEEDRRREVWLTAIEEDPADADRRVIAEQVMQPWNHALRNALAFREEAAEVYLRTDRNAARRAVDPEDRMLLAFDGAVFEPTVV